MSDPAVQPVGFVLTPALVNVSLSNYSSYLTNGIIACSNSIVNRECPRFRALPLSLSRLNMGLLDPFGKTSSRSCIFQIVAVEYGDGNTIQYMFYCGYCKSIFLDKS